MTKKYLVKGHHLQWN